MAAPISNCLRTKTNAWEVLRISPRQRATAPADEHAYDHAEPHANLAELYNRKLLSLHRSGDADRTKVRRLTWFPMNGVTMKDARQLVPMMTPYTVAVKPFSSAMRGKNGGKRQTASDDVSVARSKTSRVTHCRRVYFLRNEVPV